MSAWAGIPNTGSTFGPRFAGAPRSAPNFAPHGTCEIPMGAEGASAKGWSGMILPVILIAAAIGTAYIFFLFKKIEKRVLSVQRAADSALASAAGAEVSAVRSASAFEDISKSLPVGEAIHTAPPTEDVRALRQRLEALELQTKIGRSGGMHLATDTAIGARGEKAALAL